MNVFQINFGALLIFSKECNSFKFLFFLNNKQLYFMKGICWYHIWSFKNTNLLNINEGLYFLYM